MWTNNCEHFVMYCATGEKESKQVQLAVGAAAVLGGIAIGLWLFGGDSKEDSS